MLWNWYTVDSCFISSTWRITSKGKFAGSCIGVICLVIVLECLRRLQREYDAYLVKQYRKRNAQVRITSSCVQLRCGVCCTKLLTCCVRHISQSANLHRKVHVIQTSRPTAVTRTMAMPSSFPRHLTSLTTKCHSSRSVWYPPCSSRSSVP